MGGKELLRGRPASSGPREGRKSTDTSVPGCALPSGRNGRVWRIDRDRLVKFCPTVDLFYSKLLQHVFVH